MTLQFMHDWTHSVNKDKVTNKNCNIAQTQWEDLFNETFLMKGLALLFEVFVIFTLFTV